MIIKQLWENGELYQKIKINEETIKAQYNNGYTSIYTLGNYFLATVPHGGRLEISADDQSQLHNK